MSTVTRSYLLSTLGEVIFELLLRFLRGNKRNLLIQRKKTNRVYT